MRAHDVLQRVAEVGDAGHLAGEDVDELSRVGRRQREALRSHSRQGALTRLDTFVGTVADEDGAVLAEHAVGRRGASPEVVAADESGDEC